jgi:hypothetical protein
MPRVSISNMAHFRPLTIERTLIATSHPASRLYELLDETKRLYAIDLDLGNLRTIKLQNLAPMRSLQMGRDKKCPNESYCAPSAYEYARLGDNIPEASTASRIQYWFLQPINTH